MIWILAVSLLCYSLAFSASAVLAAGTAAQLIYMFLRGVELGRLPLLGPHDTMIFFALCIGASAVIISLSPALQRERWFRGASGLAAALLTGMALLFPALAMPLPRILDTFWFELHVVMAFWGYALFAAGGTLCAAWLLRGRKQYLELQFKTALTGWVFFSVSMMSGGIWGYYAWGTYWLWTPKEIWTSVLWLFYALFLHLRLKGSQGEKVTAWLGLAGVVVMMFTYMGVSMLMKSSHSF